jgi:hypothetical protein
MYVDGVLTAVFLDQVQQHSLAIIRCLIAVRMQFLTLSAVQQRSVFGFQTQSEPT